MADQPQYVGIGEDLLSAPRIDNLSGVQAVLTGITEGSRDGINVAAFFDHEEIGSRTKQGAGSTLLTMVLEKLFQGSGMDRLEYLQQMDGEHAAVRGCGTCLSSELCGQDGSHQSESFEYRILYQRGKLSVLCNRLPCDSHCGADLPPGGNFIHKIFQPCSDGTGGSTLGSIASSFLPIPTVDVGVPLLAMHSSRELMGVKDIRALADMIRAYYTL